MDVKEKILEKEEYEMVYPKDCLDEVMMFSLEPAIGNIGKIGNELLLNSRMDDGCGYIGGMFTCKLSDGTSFEYFYTI